MTDQFLKFDLVLWHSLSFINSLTHPPLTYSLVYLFAHQSILLTHPYSYTSTHLNVHTSNPFISTQLCTGSDTSKDGPGKGRTQTQDKTQGVYYHVRRVANWGSLSHATVLTWNTQEIYLRPNAFTACSCASTRQDLPPHFNTTATDSARRCGSLSRGNTTTKLHRSWRGELTLFSWILTTISCGETSTP